MTVCFNTAECIIPTRRISSADLDAPRIQRKEGERKCTWRTFYVLRAPPQLRPCSRGWVGCRRPSSVSVTRHRNGGERSQGKKGKKFFCKPCSLSCRPLSFPGVPFSYFCCQAPLLSLSDRRPTICFAELPSQFPSADKQVCNAWELLRGT